MRSNHGTHILSVWLNQNVNISDTNIVSNDGTDAYSSYDEWLRLNPHPWFMVVEGRGKSEIKFQPYFDEQSIRNACQGGYLLDYTKRVIDLFEPGHRSRAYHTMIEPVYQQLSRFWTSESGAFRCVLDSYAEKE